MAEQKGQIEIAIIATRDPVLIDKLSALLEPYKDPNDKDGVAWFLASVGPIVDTCTPSHIIAHVGDAIGLNLSEKKVVVN